VQKYDKGSNRISGSRMAQFCQLLNVTPNDFFKGVPGINQKADGGAQHYKRAIIRLVTRNLHERQETERSDAVHNKWRSVAGLQATRDPIAREEAFVSSLVALI